MIRINARTLLILGAALTALPAPGASAAGGVVTLSSCSTISKSGAYVLGQNLTRTGDCFKVQAKFVTFDLNGLTLSGNGSGSAITDNGSAQQAILVRNGVISNFAAGVNLAATTSARVENLRLIGNVGTGATVGTGGLVKDCTVTGGTDGILAGAGSAVTGNNVIGAAEAGIMAACPSTLLGNTATGSPGGCTAGVNCANIVTTGSDCTIEENTAP